MTVEVFPPHTRLEDLLRLPLISTRGPLLDHVRLHAFLQPRPALQANALFLPQVPRFFWGGTVLMKGQGHTQARSLTPVKAGSSRLAEHHETYDHDPRLDLTWWAILHQRARELNPSTTLRTYHPQGQRARDRRQAYDRPLPPRILGVT